jgi:hypothetical protein
MLICVYVLWIECCGTDRYSTSFYASTHTRTVGFAFPDRFFLSNILTPGDIELTRVSLSIRVFASLGSDMLHAVHFEMTGLTKGDQYCIGILRVMVYVASRHIDAIFFAAGFANAGVLVLHPASLTLPTSSLFTPS